MDSPKSTPPSSPESTPSSSPPSSPPSPPRSPSQEQPAHLRGVVFYAALSSLSRPNSWSPVDPFAASSSRSRENNMVGFGSTIERSLPEAVRGRPYFYYENSATASKDVWRIMKDFLFDIDPEFVDSGMFFAARRRCGYIHNLPVMNRFMPDAQPRMTIGDVCPHYGRFWPVWDRRTNINTETSTRPPTGIVDGINLGLAVYKGNPPARFLREVSSLCAKYNLVWVHRDKVGSLEYDDIASPLGFPHYYARCLSDDPNLFFYLHNSSQVDTVAYHLSALREEFKKGITVLSLLTGTAADIVALHRLQIPLKGVVSVELSAEKMELLENFWIANDLQLHGKLKQYARVEYLIDEFIEGLVKEFGGFDLVLGRNRIREEAGLRLFYDFCRILGKVGC